MTTLYAGPVDDPAGWAHAAARGCGAVTVLRLPQLDIDGTRPQRWARIADGIVSLLAAGAGPIGHIDLSYATRQVADIASDINLWAALPVVGIFFDHAPAGTYHIGPVALAVRMARRVGLDTVVLNAGVPVDPIYRRLNTTVCSFEGSWAEYLNWSAEESEPGDGHLVYGTPRADWDAAETLITARGAGLMLVTDRATPDE